MVEHEYMLQIQVINLSYTQRIKRPENKTPNIANPLL